MRKNSLRRWYVVGAFTRALPLSFLQSGKLCFPGQEPREYFSGVCAAKAVETVPCDTCDSEVWGRLSPVASV